MVLLLK